MVSATSRSGIAAGASKKAFYIGAAAVGTILGGLLLSRYFLRRQEQVISPTNSPIPGSIKLLASLERIEPVPADKLSGQHCAQCKTPAQGKGDWYNLGGRLYCQECAPGQANKAGVTLAERGLLQAQKNEPVRLGQKFSWLVRLVKPGTSWVAP